MKWRKTRSYMVLPGKGTRRHSRVGLKRKKLGDLDRGGTYATFSKLELFYKWIQLWLYMRLWDVKRFFEKFSVLIPHRPPQISEKWGEMAHFGRFPTFSYWLVGSLNY